VFARPGSTSTPLWTTAGRATAPTRHASCARASSSLDTADELRRPTRPTRIGPAGPMRRTPRLVRGLRSRPPGSARGDPFAPEGEASCACTETSAFRRSLLHQPQRAHSRAGLPRTPAARDARQKHIFLLAYDGSNRSRRHWPALPGAERQRCIRMAVSRGRSAGNRLQASKLASLTVAPGDMVARDRPA